jgi:hypothetical protein
LGLWPTMAARMLPKRLLSLLVRNQTQPQPQPQPQTGFLKGASHCLYPSCKNPRNYTRYDWCVWNHDVLLSWSLGIMGLGELKTRMLCWISKKTEEIETCILKFWRLCTFFIELECCEHVAKLWVVFGSAQKCYQCQNST